MDYFDLNMNLSKEDIALKENANKFARDVMRPISKELDRMTPEEAIAAGSPFWTFMKKAYELGYHILPFPEVFGGSGLNPLQIAIVMEELAWGSFGLTLGLNTSFDAAVAMEAGEEHIKNFTIPYCSCKDGSYIGCWGITEPNHGTDAISCYPSTRDPNFKGNCRARLEGEEYVINGQKASWVSGGTIANHIFLNCQIESSSGREEWGMFIFSLDRPGVAKGKPLDKLGVRELNQGEIYFDDVRVPKNALIVGPEYYERALEAHLCLTTPMVGVWSVGLARAAFDEALTYAKERIQSGKPLVDHPTIQQKLFDMFRKIEAARQLSRAAFVYNWSNPPEKRLIEYGIAAKTFCTQTALEVTSEAIQILGGNGLAKEYLVEKLFRDARSALIADGANDSLTIAAGYKITRAYPSKP